MKARALILGLLATGAPFLAAADTVLRLPENATQGYRDTVARTSMQLPVGPFAAGAVETLPVEGAVTRSVWKTPGAQQQTFDLMRPLRDQLETLGFSILFECETRDCGGFDFRFHPSMVDEPEMHVDLGDFRYLAAARTSESGQEYIGLMVSRSPDRGFVQVTRVGAGAEDTAEVAQSTKQPEATDAPRPDSGLDAILVGTGSAVLDGLEFLKGSAELSGSPAESLRELARFMDAYPAQKVVLVGHTDATGSLKRNIALSRQRAASVMQRLVDTYGVSPARLSAEGVGYLSPRATNATQAGRDQNRRVEVVLTAAPE